jgi:hypothetical protein
LDYREGVVTEEKSELGSLVDCGIPNRLVEWVSVSEYESV